MSVPYIVFSKYAEKMTKLVSETRPVLKGIFHKDNGDLIVTDSHRLYMAKNSHSRDDNAVIDPVTGMTIDGNYPEVSRLMPDEACKTEIVVEDLKAVIDVLDVFIRAGSLKSKAVNMKTPKEKISGFLEFDDITAALKHETSLIELKYVFPPAVKNDGLEKVTFSLEYLSQALKLFKDSGYRVASLKFYGPLRPFIVTNHDGSLIALILPMKTGGAE